MTLRKLFALMVLMVGMGAPVVWGQATEPAKVVEAGVAGVDSAGDDELGELTVRIVMAKGLAQYRLSEEADWEAAKGGVELPLGAEFRTGPRSQIQFSIGGNHTITLDRLGVIKVLDAIKRDGKVLTELGMEYGRSSYQVQLGGVEHESKIRTPSATLAVRGSKGMIQEYAGRAPVAGSDYGKVAFINTRGVEVALKPETRIEGHQTASAQHSAQLGTFLPKIEGTTLEEMVAIEDQPLFGIPGTGGGGGKLLGPPPPKLPPLMIPPEFLVNGFFDAVVKFVSNPTGQAVNVDIAMQPPSGHLVTASNQNPIFQHLGNISHAGVSSVQVAEGITNRAGFEVGAYTLTAVNRSSSVRADLEVFVGVGIRPEGADYIIPYVLIGNGEGGEFSSLGPLESKTFSFTVPDVRE